MANPNLESETIQKPTGVCLQHVDHPQVGISKAQAQTPIDGMASRYADAVKRPGEPFVLYKVDKKCTKRLTTPDYLTCHIPSSSPSLL